MLLLYPFICNSRSSSCQQKCRCVLLHMLSLWVIVVLMLLFISNNFLDAFHTTTHLSRTNKSYTTTAITTSILVPKMEEEFQRRIYDQTKDLLFIREPRLVVPSTGSSLLLSRTTTTTTLFATKGNSGNNSRGGNKSKKGKSSTKSGPMKLKVNSKSSSTNNKKVSKKMKTTTISNNNISTMQQQPIQMIEPTIQSSQQRPVVKKLNSVPPWQVLSTKEVKENIEREKIRRSNIQKGIIPSHAMMQVRNRKNKDNEEDEDDEDTDFLRPKISKAFLSSSDRRLLKWKRFNPQSAIKKSKFVGSYLDPKILPPRLGVPEIAFLGRSNVGKSSLLNCLTRISSSNTNQVDIARVGKTPGATASVNLYSLYDHKEREILNWVDLPGFGYAKLSKDIKDSVQLAAENYLNKRKELALGILLVDIRREPSDDDRNVLNALYDMNLPIVVVATKIDKCSNQYEIETSLRTIQEKLNLPKEQLPFCVSSTTGEGIRDLWQIILDGCEYYIAEEKMKYEDTTEIVNQQQQSNSNNDDDDDDNDNEMMYNKNNKYKGGYSTTNAFFEEDENNDDIEYDQGYDWLDENGIMYNDDEDDDFNSSNNNNNKKNAVSYGTSSSSSEFDDYDDDDNFNNNNNNNKKQQVQQQQQQVQPPRETLKTLRKKVKEMEKRGEI